MDEFRFDITPEIIEADITLANYIYNMNGRTQALLNMCGYHATQAIEKSLKLILYSVDPKRYEDEGLFRTHSIEAILCNIEAAKSGFISAHQEIVDTCRLFTKMNTSRYGEYNASQGAACRVIHLARDLFSEVDREYGMQYRSCSEESKTLCTNDTYISRAALLLERAMHELTEVNTPNGKANPADGYMINSVKQGNRAIHIEVTMLSRSKADGDAPREGDRAAFTIAKGMVYEDKPRHKPYEKE